MSGRLPSGLLVSALLRRVNDSGGFGAVLAKGDAQAGNILVILAERGTPIRAVERGIGPGGNTILIESRAGDDVPDYWNRRRLGDPDMWVMELDSPQAERFTAETLLAD